MLNVQAPVQCDYPWQIHKDFFIFLRKPAVPIRSLKLPVTPFFSRTAGQHFSLVLVISADHTRAGGQLFDKRHNAFRKRNAHVTIPAKNKFVNLHFSALSRTARRAG